MNAFYCGLLGGVLGLPLAAAAQQPAATHPPVIYRVGPARAPLFSSLSATSRPPNAYAPSQSVLSAVGELPPQWVVVEREGFRYLTPASALVNYDAADADPVPLDGTTHRIAYEGVVQVPGVSQANLYARARAWVAKAYNQQNAHVTREDPTAGQIQLQGERLAQVYQDYQGVPRSTYAGVVRHSLTIYVKDGRYKYVLTDFAHDAKATPNLHSGGALEQKRANLYGYGGLGSHQQWSELKTDALRDARTLMADLQAAMTLGQMPAKKEASDF